MNRRLLLDTHVLLWAWEDSSRLGRIGRKLLADPEQPVVVSIVSIWELAIKQSVGKLSLDVQLEDLVRSLGVFGFELLPVLPAHILVLAALPLHHRDPFDRTLVAQAIHENLHLVTADPHLQEYDVQAIRL
ncbi:MAG: type II toxin-antitoxin system VapC family toxin [Flavobacteriales bacterium]|nr:type II toxin-antitoxin system VapC family toxin [Flavobacteriales bacterium]MEB2343068.1 type II toxin-antitoxin system VapC family toxin [Flavobacteriia bacterium]